tara:strand:- start:608 stop:802 length:195 start_codon:yes stop_codon:yes gene_type:complete
MVFNEFYNAENPDIERTCEFIAIEKITTEFCVKILKLQLKNGTCENVELSSLYKKLLALEKEST